MKDEPDEPPQSTEYVHWRNRLEGDIAAHMFEKITRAHNSIIVVGLPTDCKHRDFTVSYDVLSYATQKQMG